MGRETPPLRTLGADVPGAAGPGAAPSECTFQGSGLCGARRHGAGSAPGLRLAGPARGPNLDSRAGGASEPWGFRGPRCVR